jgi:8-oxo-dGTP pyrophosphatase MutT (NUDIX family)
MSDEAIPAATLILVADRPGAPPAILMVERAGGMAFAAGALVFPGGRIDPADDALGNGAAIAAIRETIEETAIPAGIDPLPDAPLAERLQRELLADRPLADLLAHAGLALTPDALVPFARWVPKFHAVRRFDTMFFVARADAERAPRVIGGECAGAHWLGAQEVLDMEVGGTARLIFPTRRNLERLAQHADFASIAADARAHPVEPISPWLEEQDGRPMITIPGHLGYPVTAEPFEGQWRG